MKKEWMDRHVENLMKQIVKVELGLLTREELYAFLELSTEVAYDAGKSDGYLTGYFECEDEFLENLQ
jgi:hypothetical protein